MKSTPHFVLFSRTGERTCNGDLHGGSWYFRLESDNGDIRFEASDVEIEASPERLDLLSVVRGLEALEQPSLVTLVTSSRQVSRAVRQGLEYWRIRDWKWERFGEKVPMKNGDLWKRIDCALQIHDVRCRTFRIDSAHENHRRLRTHAIVRGRQGFEAAMSRAKPTQHRLVFRPFIWAAHKTAQSMHAVANTLQRCVPEAPSPHLT